MNERKQKSNDNVLEDIDQEGGEIRHIGELNCGDTVVFGDRWKPLMVVNTAMQEKESPVLDETLYTPIALLRSDWARAEEVVLAHKIKRIMAVDGQYDPALEELDQTVAMPAKRVVRGDWTKSTEASIQRVEEQACDIEVSDRTVVKA